MVLNQSSLLQPIRIVLFSGWREDMTFYILRVIRLIILTRLSIPKLICAITLGINS